MKPKIVNFSMILLTAILFMLLTSRVAAARCQINNISYAYPHQAAPTQRIQINTIVAGSCVSNGEDYYSVRVDLVDRNSNSIISSTNTPIGYNAKNFTITTNNIVTTPPRNLTWPLRVYVYVVRAGGTSGAYLFDYTTIGNATIQVGAIAIPEFHINSVVVTVALCATTMILARKSRENN